MKAITNDVVIKKESKNHEIIRRFMKNKPAVISLIVLLILIFCALFPGVVAPYDYTEQVLSNQFAPPSLEHLFGCDEFGRDIFSRVVYGCRTSLFIGVSSVIISCIIGTALGCISGFYGNVIDNVIMRLIDIILAIPNTLLGISIVAALGNTPFNLVLAIGLGAMSAYARLVRAAVMTAKDQEYVEAARSNGASDLRIILKYILPNCLSPIIVQATLGVATAILTAAGLSFIGLGIAPPTPEWGAMLSSGRSYIRDHWHVVTFPGLAIMITVFSFNLVGDGLRDALDPRLKN